MANRIIREQVARALFNKGLTLAQLGRPVEEIEVYEKLIRDYQADGKPEIREQVAIALFNKGLTLGELGRSVEEIEAI